MMSHNNAVVLWGSQMCSVSILAIFVYYVAGSTPASILYSQKALIVGAYSAIFTTMLPILFPTYAQKYLSAIFVSFTYLLEPLWAAGLAFLFLAEKMSDLQMIGGAMVLSASFFMWFGDLKKGDPATSVG